MFGEPERKLRDQVRDHKSSLGEKESGVDDESRVENSKGPHLENIQQVELRGLSDTGDVVAIFCLESTWRADEIQSDHINTLRY